MQIKCVKCLQFRILSSSVFKRCENEILPLFGVGVKTNLSHVSRKNRFRVSKSRELGE